MILGCMVPEDLAAAGDSGIFCSGIWDDLSCGHCLNMEGLVSCHEKMVCAKLQRSRFI